MNAVERGLDWIGTRFWSFVDNLIHRVNMLNMTNSRQVLSLACIAGTAVVYLGLAIKTAVIPDASPWIPDWQWLGFLGVLSGLDIAQFRTKRTTDTEYMANKAAVARATGATPGVEQ